MAHHELPDFDALALELIQLEHREADIERRLAIAQDRNATFASEFNDRQATKMNTELVERRRRINDLRVQLLPIMRRVK